LASLHNKELKYSSVALTVCIVYYFSFSVSFHLLQSSYPSAAAAAAVAVAAVAVAVAVAANRQSHVLRRCCVKNEKDHS
jgi:protein-S-isoprenylcysteine O-methyltransferase Ste14